jgi:anthranilate synthase/indole-3-glycerol phosphate synthase/phosphoribosylanthranilate isomerase
LSTILETIVEQRRKDVAAAKAAVPPEELHRIAAAAPPAMDIVGRLRAAAPMALMAEVKRASPSKGDIAPDIDAAEQALIYAKGGAAAISILTEPTWFKGTLEDMRCTRERLDRLGPSRPAVLRKDFIVDEYQVVEARVHGADSVLLIVAALPGDELGRLMACCRGQGMEPLVEVNSTEEMRRAVAAGATFIGINNRDLRDFSVDLGTTDRLASLAGPDVLLAALSGIQSRADVLRFQDAGCGAVLVGEALMTAADPGVRIAELVGA